METPVTLSRRKGPCTPAGQELVSKIVEGNRGWLCPTVKKLAYTFSMKGAHPGQEWSANVEYAGPNDVAVSPCDGEAYRGAMDDSYDPYNSDASSRLTTLLQGVTFFGPLHELLRNPKNYALSLIGEEPLNDREACVLHVRFSPQLDEQGAAQWDKELRRRAEREQYRYEFVPTEKQINGNKRVVVEVKCLYEKGSLWSDIMAAHRAGPSCLRCGGKIIHAKVREYQGKQRPMIVLGDDAGFQGGSRFTSISFAGGENNMTPRLWLGEGERIFDTALYEKLKAEKPTPDRGLAMHVGCGVWGMWYGYSGRNAQVDQIWVDKATGLVLREEGFYDGVCGFTVDYSDFMPLSTGRQAPGRVVVTLLDQFPPDPWVFDMRFTTVDGKTWLLERLTESSPKDGAEVTAEVFDVEADVE